jgi:hypothetical protein
VISERVDLIDQMLSLHQKHKATGVLVCRCGYEFRIGESIHLHRAEVIVAAIALLEAGIDRDRIPEAALHVAAFTPRRPRI